MAAKIIQVDKIDSDNNALINSSKDKDGPLLLNAKSDPYEQRDPSLLVFMKTQSEGPPQQRISNRRSADISDAEFAQLRSGNHRYQDDGKIFHMAIIDYLQQYNTVKKIERFCVPLCKRVDQDTISVAKP